MAGRRDRPLIVAAVGGNALLRRGEVPDLAHQLANVRSAVASLADLAATADLVITHGNGPQVGLLAAASQAGGPPSRLDVLDAETQGQIGYLLSVEMANAIGSRAIVTLLTQVEVDPFDPGFASPSKPIGQTYDEPAAMDLARRNDWTVGPDGDGWRRLVASPEPERIVEIASIDLLVRAGTIVVCAGGGGIPVVRGSDGRRSGVEAVVDKDLTTALLASQLGADQLLLLTDVDAVHDGWGTDHARPIDRIDVASLRRRDLPRGSMGPKAEAACRFAEAGGFAAIGALDDAVDLSGGRAGTTVVSESG
jgi:carbamate kinase